MKDCNKIKNDMVAYIYNETDEKTNREIKAHLESCTECRREYEKLREVLLYADSLKEDIDKAVGSVDWDALPSQIAERAFSKKHNHNRQAHEKKTLKHFLNFLFTPKWAPVYAALLAGIIIGGALTFIFLRPGAAPEETSPSPFMVSSDFIETMDVEMARRETLDYLEQSQYLLLDFVQSSPEGAAQHWGSDFMEAKTSELLSKKKYMNDQLDKYHMAKAKALCDQIEILLLELTAMSGELSDAERDRIRELIEQRQIILKINLIKKELQQSEV